MKTEETKNIERSIIKKFRKNIWRGFIDSINTFSLIEENDQIAVCISGGKDSFLLAKCMQEIKRHGKVNFTLKFICMDPGYKKEHVEKIKENAQKLDIPLEIFTTNVFEVSNILNSEHPCYMCARMRRGYLYDYAKKLGCNKIALAHHFDDVIETVLLAMFYSGSFKTMMPRVKSDHFEGMELIRPMYFVREDDIKDWVKYNQLEFLDCGCKFVQRKQESKRKEIKEILKELRKINPYIDKNIYRSTERVNLSTILSYQDEEKIYSVLDERKKD